MPSPARSSGTASATGPSSGWTEYLHDFGLTLTGVTAGQPGLKLIDPGFQQVVMAGIEEQRLPG